MSPSQAPALRRRSAKPPSPRRISSAGGTSTASTMRSSAARSGGARRYSTTSWSPPSSARSSTDLDWSTPVDPERVALEMAPAAAMFQQRMAELPGSPVARWGPKEWTQFQVQALNWRMSQFLHGEQGALICTAKIVATTPWIDAKYYAATQVMDEARHVEVFSRYLDTKLEGHYPVNPALQLLIDEIIGDSRWDMTYMGMQIMVEGLALAAFGFMHHVTEEPLLKKLLRYVMADEARHVAFGVLSLQEYYAGLGAAELRERQEFAFEAALRMRDRLMMHRVWETMGVDRRTVTEFLLGVRRMRPCSGSPSRSNTSASGVGCGRPSTSTVSVSSTTANRPSAEYVTRSTRIS